MAGLAGLPYFLQYQQQAQEQALQRQYAQIQLAQFQQQQQDRQRQQAALTAAGNALPQLLAGQQSAQMRVSRSAAEQGRCSSAQSPPLHGRASCGEAHVA